MLNPDAYRKNYLIDNHLFDQADPEDIEIAYLLQHGRTSSPEFIERLVRRYSSRLYPWAALLLHNRKQLVSSHGEVLLFLQQVYIDAIKRVEEFTGYLSVGEWLFSIAYQLTQRKMRWKPENGFVQPAQIDDQHPSYTEKANGIDWDILVNLPDKYRMAMILRYLIDLKTQDISHILKIQSKEVQSYLNKGREQVSTNIAPSHMTEKIQSYLDYSLDGKPDELAALENHLSTCLECQAYITKYTEVDQAFREKIKSSWSFHALIDGDINRIIQAILTSITQSIENPPFILPFRKIAWIFGFSLMFTVLAFIFIRLTPTETIEPKRMPTPTPNLPPVVQMQSSPKNAGMQVEQPGIPSYIEPAFSQDGNWGAFSLIWHDPTTQGIMLPTVELFNRNTGEIKIIQESNSILNMPWLWWNLVPGISADGQWVTFVSSIPQPDVEGPACKTSSQFDCLDVFLYNHKAGNTIRITQGVNGEAANGYSFSPSISADGEWIAFWSAATNLVPGDGITCKGPDASVSCFYVYLYNQKTQHMERLPIPSMMRASDFSFDRISISADGQYIGYTVSIEGQPTASKNENIRTYEIAGTTFTRSIPEYTYEDFDNTSEAIVYDRDSGVNNILNKTFDGSMGNGASYSPVLSADGRFIAFVSDSTNLVRNDINNFQDVFILDQQSKKIDLVSSNSSGVPGNGDSGFMQYRRGFYSLDISSDGRYVTYISNADNVDQSDQNDCGQTNDCSFLYSFDRVTWLTEMISKFSDGDFSRYPNISADGRWISFMFTTHQCGSAQNVCSNVMLYDRQNQWVSNLTKYEDTTAQLPWSFAGSLPLPWELWESKALAFSQDGKLFALAGMDSKIRVWHRSTNSNSIIQDKPQILYPGTNDTLTVLTFNQDGSWLAAGSTIGYVYIWDLQRGEIIYSVKNDSSLIKSIVFSQDSSQLVVSSTNTISIWHVGDNELIQFKRFGYGQVLDISSLGNLLASDNGDGTIWLQRLPGGNLLGRISIGKDLVKELRFSTDGSNLAILSQSGTISIWRIDFGSHDAITILPINSIPSTGSEGNLLFTPDKQYITSTSENGTLLFWRVQDGEKFYISSTAPYNFVNGLAYSFTGNQMAVIADNEILFWNLVEKNTYSYFLTSNQDTFVDTTPFTVLVKNDIPQFFKPLSFSTGSQVNLEQAAAYLIFTPLVPTRLPEPITFLGAMVNSERSILLHYAAPGQLGEQASLYLLERYMTNIDSPAMAVGSHAEVIPTQIDTMFGSVNAEYVSGDWVFTHSITPPVAGSLMGDMHDIWQWDPTLVTQRLRWQQYDILFSLYYRVNGMIISAVEDTIRTGMDAQLVPILNRADLIQIANSLKWYTDIETNNIK